jgi:hypothetical protein
MDSPLPSGEDGLAVPEALGDRRLVVELALAPDDVRVTIG